MSLQKMQRMTERLKKSPVIGTCSYKSVSVENEAINLIRKLSREYDIPDFGNTHNVRQCEKWISCKECKKIWCCTECAIEDGAITGLKQYRKQITCLKCKNDRLS